MRTEITRVDYACKDSAVEKETELLAVKPTSRGLWGRGWSLRFWDRREGIQGDRLKGVLSLTTASERQPIPTI